LGVASVGRNIARPFALSAVVERAVLDREGVGRVEIGEVDIERQLLARRLLAVETDGEIVEQLLGRHRLDGVRAGRVDAA
jgi:hypothetical protein